MDKECIDLMKENETYYVPTITAGAFVAEKAKIEGYYPEIVRPKAEKIGPLLKSTFQKAYEAGGTIAFGTDSGVSYHGDNAKEFSSMVDAGMDPLDAIMSATIVAARLLGEEENLGSVEKGKKADIIGVSGNPLEDISVLENVVFVMKNGKIYKNETNKKGGINE